MKKLSREELAQFLKEKADQYAKYSFVQDDPIQIPHSFSTAEDIEISGLIAATLSWGNRKTIIAKSNDLMDRMDRSPAEFIRGASESDLETFNGFVHRTFQSEDIKGLARSLKKLYQEHESLGDFFKAHVCEGDAHLGQAFQGFKGYLLDNGLPLRAGKHFGDPSKGSACKRLIMFTRWMARSNKEGIDFGLWDIDSALLSLPLDVHSGRVARSLGLLKRKQNDWKAVLELDHSIRKIEPVDPARLDYALFGLGVYEGWK
ncbi:MAG: TIGR02757 family protein [Schleiferiaceae bacterium]|nr:TIGR02757 family protein [Schleiferiaceae bacterium]